MAANINSATSHVGTGFTPDANTVGHAVVYCLGKPCLASGHQSIAP